MEMLLNLLKVLYLSFVCLAQVRSQECLQARSEAGLPPFMDYTNNDGGYPTITFRQQAIIPTYELVCCGNITEWGVDIHPVTGAVPVIYSLDFQVWRPSPTVDDSTGKGCYSLVGNNRFTSVPIDTPTFVLSPSPEAYIEFQAGDVLGFYVEEARDNNFDGIVMLNRDSFIDETVWYASIAPTMATSQNGDCPYSVGINGVLNKFTRAAPIISVNVASYSGSCPTESNRGSGLPGSAVAGRIAVGVVVPLILIVSVAVTIVVSVIVCQVKRAKKITVRPNSVYADPRQGLDDNAAYNVVIKSNIAYSANMELKHSTIDFGKKDDISSNLNVQQGNRISCSSTENLLDSGRYEEAYATVAELEPYATVNKGDSAVEYGESIVRDEENHGENESYGSAIVREKNEANKPGNSSGAVDEYLTDYHAYDSIKQ